MNTCTRCGAEQLHQFCNDCVIAVRGLVAQAEWVYPELATEVSKESVKAPGGYTTGAESGEPAPINLGALETQESLRRALGMIATACRVRGGTVPALCQQISNHVYRLQDTTADAAHLADELEHWVRRAERTVDIRPEIVRYGHCPNCGQGLRGPSERRYVKCPDCGQLSSVVTLREGMRDKVLDELGGQWLKPLEILHALGFIGMVVSKPQISNWISRGRVEKRGGRLLFDEVVDYVERSQLSRARRVIKADDTSLK